MLKVNESLFLEDYAKLAEKKSACKARVENAAKQFAVSRGYDDKKAAEFVDYVISIEGGGLSADEEKEFAFFTKYVCEVEEPADETVEEPEEELVEDETCDEEEEDDEEPVD